MDLGGPKEAQIQSYSPGCVNVPSWEGTLTQPGEYDWTIRLQRRCGLMSNYFDHLLRLAAAICRFLVSECKLVEITLAVFAWRQMMTYFATDNKRTRIVLFWLWSERHRCKRKLLIARSELGKVCFWRCLWLFCLCLKYPRNRWTDLRQFHTEDVFGPSLGHVWRSRSKVKFTRDKNGIFGAFSGLREFYIWQNIFSL